MPSEVEIWVFGLVLPRTPTPLHSTLTTRVPFQNKNMMLVFNSQLLGFWSPKCQAPSSPFLLDQIRTIIYNSRHSPSHINSQTWQPSQLHQLHLQDIGAHTVFYDFLRFFEVCTVSPRVVYNIKTAWANISQFEFLFDKLGYRDPKVSYAILCFLVFPISHV